MWRVISFGMSSLLNRPLSTEAVLRFDPLLIPYLTKVTETSVRFADNRFHLISISSSLGESIKDCENVSYNSEVCSVYEVKSTVIYAARYY